jgi:putative DNA primase/helicase
MEKIDFDGLNRLALTNARRLVFELAPGGVMIGSEYTCASVTGGKGTSCRINVDSGKWSDFATGDKGHDFQSLWAKIYNVSQLDAAKQLAAHLGFSIPKYTQKEIPLKPAVAQDEAKRLPDYDLVAFPETVQEPTFFHSQLGACSAHYCYRSPDGERLFYIARYDTLDGKQFTPFSWCQKSGSIVPKAWQAPRPIYGLDELKKNSEAKGVLVVEGEKAAEAARKIVNSKIYTVVTWSGGSKAFEKTDWTPLYGRNVLIWADSDLKVIKTQIQADKFGLMIGDLLPNEAQPGMYAALGIAKILGIHCPVKYFSFAGHAVYGQIDGFDAADAFEMGMDWESFKTLVKPIAQVYVPPVIEVPIETSETPWVTGSGFQECVNAGMMAPKKGDFYNNMTNVVKMCQYHPNLKGKLWFDEFHLKIMTTWRTPVPVEWSDVDELMLCHVFQEQFLMSKMKPMTIREGIRVYANENRRNEPRDWMVNLKWDGVNRIESFFFEALGASPTAYTNAASKNFWIAMAARIFSPGCKMDVMVILEGKQGAYKSTCLRAIAGPWFTECNEAVTSKDFKQVLVGRLIVEIAELSSLLKGSKQEEIKAILSDPDDYFRPPYGAAPQNFKRTCVFVGTTNETEYMHDPSGARRYWPIEVGDISLKFIEKNREQLFAEAVFRFKTGETWWDMPEEETKAMQDARRQIDPWEKYMDEYVIGKTNVILSHFAENELYLEKKDIHSGTYGRLGKILKAMGWKNVNRRNTVTGKNEKVWSKVN